MNEVTVVNVVDKEPFVKRLNLGVNRERTLNGLGLR